MAKGLENAVVITIEHGTGSGLIFNGSSTGALRVWPLNSPHQAGLDGPLCQCGARGCMETHTAAFAIIHEAAKAGFRIPKKAPGLQRAIHAYPGHRRQTKRAINR